MHESLAHEIGGYIRSRDDCVNFALDRSRFDGDERFTIRLRQRIRLGVARTDKLRVGHRYAGFQIFQLAIGSQSVALRHHFRIIRNVRRD